ncbi:hypothetical protein BDV29DRAFT_159951 [Aspergillus leporis]|uniref:Zn(2)-C6 fungal-type domain-containing protein n=1 Tax=Aspergillus leporis TaxID=41062 RepID=A0A5N5WQZ4_9EURO|nr:hypothetical protein BDV29DRAFT_159951 [Aspergillus leporis]
MVNRERSGGCKERRVICDEARPNCDRCELHWTRLHPSSFQLPPGRDLDSSRGFFENLAPALLDQRHDSALTLVVSAVSESFLALWQEGARSMQVQRRSFNQAMQRLRTAVLNPTERRSPATFLVVLVMQFHESLAAIYTRRKPSRIHYSGAEALLPLSKLKDGEKVQSAHITRFMASAEVPSATREGRPVPPTAFRWLYNSDYGSVPLNLGAFLADLLSLSLVNNASDNIPPSEEESKPWHP